MRIFLSTPITQIRHNSSPEVWDAYCDEIRTVLRFLRSRRGNSVFSALEEENWGKETPTNHDVVRRDYIELKKADIIVCLYKDKVISSVLVEIGWGSALGKRIIICTQGGAEIATLIKGLDTLGESEIVFYNDINELGSILLNIL